MKLHMTAMHRATTAAALAGALLGVAAPPAHAAPGSRPVTTTTTPSFIGSATLPTGLTFEGTTVGGLSGTTYDAERDVYYALSDDRSQFSPARVYTLSIDLSDGALGPGDVTILDVTTLLDAGGQPFRALSVDPEGIALTPARTLLIVSEGDASGGIAPFVREFSLDGQQLRSFDVPAYYNPVSSGTPSAAGIRNNLAFESAGLTPQGQFLFTATENALAQDGPAATLTTTSSSRILRYNTRTGRLDKEFVYEVERVQDEPVPATGFSTNGLVELLPVSPTRLLALERGFSAGVGNTVKLYLVDLAGATDVSSLAVLPADRSRVRTANKTLLLDLGTDGVKLDNLEALAFGPTLPDGRQSLIVTSDNNFSSTQITQFLAFAL